MWDALVDRELHALGVDEDHADLLGGRAHHDRGDHRVHKARLARTGLARDQEVRGLRKVRHDITALDVLADTDDQGMLVAQGRTRTQNITEGDILTISVRDFNADRGLAGNRREDAHIRGSHGIGDVLRQVRELVDLHSRSEDDLVTGDRRASGKTGDLRVDLEVGEDLGESVNDLIVHHRAGLMRGPGDEERVLRQGVRDRLVELGLEDLPLGCWRDRRRGRLVGFGRGGGRNGLGIRIGNDRELLSRHVMR